VFESRINSTFFVDNNIKNLVKSLFMDDSLYLHFLEANASEIKKSLELLAKSAPDVEITIPSYIVEQVVWGLGYGNGRLAFDGTAKALKYDSFDEVYRRLRGTPFWRDLEEENNTSGPTEIEEKVSSKLYHAFISRFAGPIHSTCRTVHKVILN
jgi:hypothetical protein